MFVSGHKTFDNAANHKQFGYIGQGNVISNTQASSYIRGYQTVESGNSAFAPGVLQTADLAKFDKILSKPLRDRVAAHLTGDQDGILYVFFHYNRGKRITHGWILTSRHHQWLDGGTFGGEKSHCVMRAVRPLVAPATSAHEAFATM